MSKSVAASVLAAALLASCATKPVADDEAIAVPSDRAFLYQANAADAGTLIVTRDGGFQGSACDIGVLIDGKDAARLKPGERATFKIPAGEIILGVQPVGAGICSAGQARVRRETGLVIKPGVVRKYRFGIGPSGEPTIAPTTY
ncbi:hypothetical protein [Xanthomonas perforans]|uniref:hypothetical protein n=1 Tax=Xanthomonas perforans TaxID=442694 RepID=UPI001190DBDE|nr:hypothetical protein [Xanthomonas perforans]MDC9651485.1 hypothetical protein [Xanthomonas perforans]MDC9658314.1 hypothetical protein [Xanthomonas perforans]MDC9679097.1 hypothetical protein [Xanthomonas perforans]MDC9680014.1 hypothetical protein [Xanthomonas perforans]MDC9684229.1 hypothetical protein [Xanthomonas perforans]